MPERPIFFLVTSVFLLVVGGNNLWAQNSVSLDLESWLSFSVRAERVIEGGNASNESYFDLRDQLQNWNSDAQNETISVTKEIELLNSRIEALSGAAIASEVTESSDLAALITNLQIELANTNSELSLYKDITIQTENLVAQTNQILSQNLEAQFYEMKPNPLNPSIWVGSFMYFTSYFIEGYQDLVDAVSILPRRTQAVRGIPKTLLLGFIGILFLVVGRTNLSNRFQNLKVRLTTDQQQLIGRIETLTLNFVFPAIGTTFLVSAFISTGFFDFKALDLIETIPIAVLVILGGNYFSKELKSQLQLGQSSETRSWWARSQQIIKAIGWVLALGFFVEHVVQSYGATAETVSTLLFLLIILLGPLLFLLTNGIIRNFKPEKINIWYFAVKYLAYFAIIVSILGLVLGVAGFSQLAKYLLFSTAYTFAVFSGYWLALDLFIQSYKTLSSTLESEALASLMRPITLLVGTILTVIFIVILALSWGATQRELLVAWRFVLYGVDFGGQNISLITIIVFVAVIFGGYLLTKIFRFILSNSVLEYTNIEDDVKNAFLKVVSYIGLTISLIVAIALAGIDLTNLALIISALSVGIGFGLQEVVSNFISGIILLFERPINEGDWVEVSGTSGIVKKISVRSTTIETFDRSEVVVPNKDLMANAVKNWTLGSRVGRVVIPVGVAYGTSVEKVKEILLEIATNHPHVSKDPEPSVAFMNFGVDALEFEVRAVLVDVNYMISARSEINEQIQLGFEKEGIEIPFSQRDIWLRNDTINIKTA